MIKGIHIVQALRPGKIAVWYIYAWRGGPRIARVESRTKPTLSHEQLATLKMELDAQNAVDPTTLRSLIREWRSENPDRPSSPEWEALAEGTKRTWGHFLNIIEERWGDTPLSIWSDPRMTAKVVAWRDSRAATPRAADVGVGTLRTLLEFGRLRGRVTLNVAVNIPTLYRNGQRANIIWTDEDMLRFTETAERLDRMHVVDGLRLAALTGLRRADLVTLQWDHIGDIAVKKLALKTSRRKRQYVTVPIIPELRALFDELRDRPRREGVETVLVNSFGDSWTASGFGGTFNRVRDEADIVHVDDDSGERKRKHLHDIRGTFCTKLLTDAGLNDEEAARIMGWSVVQVSSIRQVYVDQSVLVASLARRMAGGSDTVDFS